MARLRQDYGAASAIDKAVRAQGGGVVKPHQVKAMILAARRAYKAQSELGLVDDGVDFDAWRKATLHDVTGGDAPESFRTVTQRDYAAVLAYFGELAGEVPSAECEVLGAGCKVQGARCGARAPSTKAPSTKHLRAADERERALWALNLEEGEVAGAFGGRGEARKYADALLWKIHKTERSLATPRQIWAVIFTLRNRAASRRRKAAPDRQASRRARKGLGARGAAGVPLSPPDGSERFPAFSRGL